MKIFKSQVGFFLAVSLLTSGGAPMAAQAEVLRNYEVSWTSSEARIAEVFDKFTYTMSVEWDQKDQAFKAQALAEFIQALSELQGAGVSSKSIQGYMERTLLDGKSQSEYHRFLNALKEQNVSPDEAAALTTEFMEKNYAEGASFNSISGSSGHWRFAVALVLIAGVTYAIVRHIEETIKESIREGTEAAARDYPFPAGGMQL